MNRRELLERTFSAHPWHGVVPGTDDAAVFSVYIEIVPTDTVKYELDKASGLLRIDRPHRFSSMCPSLYGFVPQTYCGPKVAALCEEGGFGTGLVGDGDPLDICVLTEKAVSQGNILVRARPIGGLRMIDKNEVDDKIIAVLEADLGFGHMRDLSECPPAFVDRLRHYFLSYKRTPSELGTGNSQEPVVRIVEVYGQAEALRVIATSGSDYADAFGDPKMRARALAFALED
jgi:inorganic pyrophosphatase